MTDEKRKAGPDEDGADAADEKRTYPENESPGLFGNVIGRTDNSYAGRKPDRSLIGEDIPDEEQEREADEWGERSKG